MRKLAGLILVFVLGACSSAATSAPASAGAASSAPSSAASSAPSSAPSSAAQSSPPAAGGVPADPCATLTVEELQTVTGQAFQAGVKSVTATGAACEWTQQGGNGVVTVAFRVLDYGVFQANGQNPNYGRVQGVGDEAYLIPPLNGIDVAKGNLEFTVAPVKVGTTDWQKIAPELAKLVAARVTG